MDHWSSSEETVGYLACVACDHRFFRQSIYRGFAYIKCPQCNTEGPAVLKRDVTNDGEPMGLSMKSNH